MERRMLLRGIAAAAGGAGARFPRGRAIRADGHAALRAAGQSHGARPDLDHRNRDGQITAAMYMTRSTAWTSSDRSRRWQRDTVSDDGRTCRIRLREGLQFHNGEPVRAQDCAASLGRWCRARTIRPTLAAEVDLAGLPTTTRVRDQAETGPSHCCWKRSPSPTRTSPFIMPERLARNRCQCADLARWWDPAPIAS